MPAAIRAYLSGDLDGVVRVLADAMPLEGISPAQFTRQVLLDANFRADGAIVAVDEDQIVGFALAIARQTPLENAPPDNDRGYITLFGVASDHRRRGIGSALLAAAEKFLIGQGRKIVMISPYAPGYFIPGVDVNEYAEGLKFFTSRGYGEMYRPLAMEVALWDWCVPDWVRNREAELTREGCVVRSYELALTLPLLEFAREEFPGDWVRVVRETMGRIIQGDSPMRLLVAEEGGRVVGFSHYESERFGPIGVAAAQRGRCIGQVLMYRTLAAQREAGFRKAWFLWSDDKTAARIYNSAGFKEIRRFAVLRKLLEPEGRVSKTV